MTNWQLFNYYMTIFRNFLEVESNRKALATFPSLLNCVFKCANTVSASVSLLIYIRVCAGDSLFVCEHVSCKADNECVTCILWLQSKAAWLAGQRAAVCIHKHNAHRSFDLFPQPNLSGCLPVSNSLHDWLSVSYNFDPNCVPVRSLK